MDNQKARYHVEISQPDISGIGTQVKINGEKVHRVRGIDYSVYVGETPEIKLYINGTGNFDLQCDRIILDISPENVQEATVILRNELLKHGVLYNAFYESVRSAIKEILAVGKTFDDEKLVKAIMDRVLGED